MNRLLCFFLAVTCAIAQEKSSKLQFDWSKLAAKAVEKVDLNLDGPMLEMASKFLKGEDEDEAKIKSLVQGLRGVYVKSLTFDKEGEYSEADVSAIRAQLRAPAWTNILDVQEKGESMGIFMKVNGKQTEGMVIVSAEPKELTVVQILGAFDPARLGELGGSFGIPKMKMGPKPKPNPATTKKDDD
jgi:hypothetical protein